MKSSAQIIFNVDDYAMSYPVSAEIRKGCEQGVFNSVSVCVTRTTDLKKEIQALMLIEGIQKGLHINLTEGSTPNTRLDLNSNASISTIKKEIERQLKQFSEITHELPTHLDSHQHYTYLNLNAFSALLEVAENYNIPIRSPRPFMEVQSLQRFIDRVQKRFNINLPIHPSSHATILCRLLGQSKIILRTQDIVIDLDAYPQDSENLNLCLADIASESVEIICHIKF